VFWPTASKAVTGNKKLTPEALSTLAGNGSTSVPTEIVSLLSRIKETGPLIFNLDPLAVPGKTGQFPDFRDFRYSPHLRLVTMENKTANRR
jgi:hypothetical protein